MGEQGRARRSLKYIRLAAHLASQPQSVDRIEMTVEDIEAVIGEPLPGNARFPSWWRNDDRKMHSRAWLTAGWAVLESPLREDRIVFARRTQVSEDAARG